VVWGVATSDDMAVVTIRDDGVVCKIIGWYSMVHRSMRNGSKLADGLYIKRALLAVEDFLFFSLYSFSCIAKQVTTLKQLRLLSCLDFLETNLEPLSSFWYHISVTISLRSTPPVTLSHTFWAASLYARRKALKKCPSTLQDVPEILNDILWEVWTGT